MGTVYHIVQFEDGSAYMMFDICNWECAYCVRNVGLWCSSLSADTVKRLNSMGVNHLSIDRPLEILKKNGVRQVFLGGGEPTQDPELKELMHRLKLNDINAWLITNGELLDDETFELSSGITFSIKAIDENLHQRLTGKPNEKVLKNFEKYGKDEKVIAETVFYPKLVGCEEIQRIARFCSFCKSKFQVQGGPCSAVEG